MTLIRESSEKAVARDWLNPRSLAVIAVAGAVVWSTKLIVDAYKASHRPPSTATAEHPMLRAVGTARRHVDADHVSWAITVEARAADDRTARRQLLAATEKTRAFLIARGIHANEISILPPSMEEETQTVVHRHADGTKDEDEVPKGILATQEVSVIANDIPRVLAAYRDVNAAAELELQEIEEPACGANGLGDLEQDLLSTARAELRRRAEVSAAVGGAHLGRVAAIDAGSFSAGKFEEPSLVACLHGTEVVATVSASFELK